MTNWAAEFKNEIGQKAWETPLEEINGRKFMLDARGFRQPFEREYNHPTLGRLIWSQTVAIAEKAPKPPDHEHDSAVAGFLSELNGSFPSNEMRIQFETDHDDIVLAMNTGFENVSLEQLTAWKALIREATAPREFTQEQRRIKFTGQTIRGLYIGEEIEPSQAANDWNGVFAVHCPVCRTFSKGTTINQVDILRLKAGLEPPYVCKRPCIKTK